MSHTERLSRANCRSGYGLGWAHETLLDGDADRRGEALFLFSLECPRSLDTPTTGTVRHVDVRLLLSCVNVRL